jgi:hypothetical protein
VCVVWVRLGNLPLRALLQRIAGQLHEVHEMLKTRSMRVIEIRDPPR